MLVYSILYRTTKDVLKIPMRHNQLATETPQHMDLMNPRTVLPVHY